MNFKGFSIYRPDKDYWSAGQKITYGPLINQGHIIQTLLVRSDQFWNLRFYYCLGVYNYYDDLTNKWHSYASYAVLRTKDRSVVQLIHYSMLYILILFMVNILEPMWSHFRSFYNLAVCLVFWITLNTGKNWYMSFPYF